MSPGRNTLYHGDNLLILRQHIPDNVVDTLAGRYSCRKQWNLGNRYYRVRPIKTCKLFQTAARWFCRPGQPVMLSHANKMTEQAIEERAEGARLFGTGEGSWAIGTAARYSCCRQEREINQG